MKLPFFGSNLRSIKLSDSEILFILESLSTMIATGIPILEAFNSISEDTTSSKTKLVVKTISDRINSGKSLSESLAEFPATFDQVFISIVKSGEASGNLDKVLSEAAENLKSNIETKSDIKSALLYPSIIVGILFLVAFFVFGYSLPQVAKVFFDLKIDLPSYSTILLQSALWFGANKILVVFLFTVLLFSIYLLLKINSVRKPVLNLIFSLPFVSKITHLMDLARFSRTSGLLLSAGVPIIETLDIAKSVVVSGRIRRDIEAIRNDLTQGLTLEKSMKATPKSFPSLLRRVVGIGEESGNLDKALTNLSKFYERKFKEIIKNLTVIIEPILIILIAVLVALVLVSVVLPIYQGIGRLNRP